MTTQIWIIVGIGVFLYGAFVGLSLWLAPKWFKSQFSEREKFLTDMVMKSEKTYLDLQAELKVYKDINAEKDRRLEERDRRSLERDREIEALKAEVKRLELELARVTKELTDKNVIPTKSIEKILSIWSEAQGQPKLDQDSEAEILYNTGFPFVPIEKGKCTRIGVLLEIDRHRPTILQISCHGDENGILLDDGIAEPGFWTEAVRDKGIRAAILMSCQSGEQTEFNIADAMIRGGVVSVISCSDKILDQYAVDFVKFFYIKLSEGLSIASAFSSAKFAIPRTESHMIQLRLKNP